MVNPPGASLGKISESQERMTLRTNAVALLIGFVIGAASIGAVLSTSTGETEVRISARQLEDGRIEFALQQKGSDQDWGGRLLPRPRLFPAVVEHGKWLNSGPLTLRLEPPSERVTQDGSADEFRFLVEIISLRAIESSGGTIGYSVVLRNNTDQPIRSIRVGVQAKNNAGVASACNEDYTYICDPLSSSYVSDYAVNRTIVSGRTITLTRPSVRGWSANDDIATLSAKLTWVEFRQGTPARWGGCRDAATYGYCPEAQIVTVRLD